ncbi:hypothetical protein [Alcanivorax sediminis]|uniref:Lipoprotein n=1 Tax=Alcanivorax sediminis TaxID=2663008 RepID=A0A6N7LUN7_9GAMM|nr:hypothetical protein [Alcanivorax sediminis]MQX52924.1 hypothetical protein [Alcanivorax sediminis]
MRRWLWFMAALLVSGCSSLDRYDRYAESIELECDTVAHEFIFSVGSNSISLEGIIVPIIPSERNHWALFRFSQACPAVYVDNMQMQFEKTSGGHCYYHQEYKGRLSEEQEFRVEASGCSPKKVKSKRKTNWLYLPFPVAV